MRRLILTAALLGACTPDILVAPTGKGAPDDEPDTGLPLDQPDIEVTPDVLRFGKLPPGCTSEALEVTVKNVGTADLDVTDLRLAGARAGAYTLVKAPKRVLAPDQSMVVTLTFEADEIRPYNAAWLEVASNDPDEPVSKVDLSAAGDEFAYAEELFFQENQANVDVLFSIDQSGSMGGEIQDLANAFDVFITAFVNLGLDYRIAVATADPDANCASFAGPYISNTTADPVAEFNTQATMSRPCGTEAAFAASRASLTSAEGQAFLRQDASLAVIGVSDEEEQSTLFSPQQYAQWLTNLKGGDPTRVSFNGLVGPQSGNIIAGGCPVSSGSDADPAPRYHNAIRLTGGVWGNLCDFDVGPFLQQTSFVAAGLEFRFPLANIPSTANPNDYTVTVDGVEVPWDGFDGWTYDSSDNAIEFHGTSLPNPGAEIVVVYPYDAVCGP
ncbi:MAG: hypothetical protein H6732_01270 [Alphaproteobacteria bacterium]|nr:hypothetical protein [Alphaproteobacteria bacterium]